MKMKKTICFDDVLLVPHYSDVKSRHDIDLTMDAGNLKLLMPIMAAPMDTICEDEMALVMSICGGLGIIHRYQAIEKQAEMVKKVASKGHIVFGSVGVQDTISDARKLVEAGARGILVDTANGHNELAIDAVRRLNYSFSEHIHIMAGNVSTWNGFKALADAGANSVRVGIGGGSMCTTRIVTGHGMPTLQSVIDIASMKEESGIDCAIIADGGIRNSGDMVKAYAAGADFVMIGSLLAGTSRTPGRTINGQKEFRGMASEAAQRVVGKLSVVEGASTTVPYKGSTESVLKTLTNGIRSGVSYSGAKSLEELAIMAEFIEISQNGMRESLPHGTLL